MKLINEDKTDFSQEVMIQLAIMLEVVYATEIMAYKVSRTLDNSGYRNTLFQQKKKCFNEGRRKIESLIKDFEVAFDTTFDGIMNRPGEEVERSDFVQGLANDIVQLLLIYYARGDGDQEKKDSMKRALLNFKPIKDIDLDEIMRYYNFKL